MDFFHLLIRSDLKLMGKSILRETIFKKILLKFVIKYVLEDRG